MNRPLELRQAGRLDNVFAEPGLAAFPNVVFHAVTAHGDALYWIKSPDLFHQFVTIDIRQANIADDYVERLLACQLERGGRAPRRLDDVTRSRQKFAQDKCRIGIVVYEQNAQRFTAPTRAIRWPSMFICIFRNKREFHREGRPLLRAGALCSDRSAVQLDQILGNRQP
jgi:hypothetical protein